MGTFGDKATELVEGALTGLVAAAGPTVTVEDTAPIVANITNETTKAEVTALLAQLASDTLTPAERIQAEADLNGFLARTPDSILTAEQKTALYKSATGTVASFAGKQLAAAKGLDTKLTVEDFSLLGTTVEELASLTGLSTDQITNMSVSDLQNTLATVGQQQFGETQAVQAGMASGLLSSTERAALRDTLRSMEETGVAGAESQFVSVLKDIDEGTTVDIGGKSYSVEEILSEETLTDILTDYFNDPKSKSSLLLAKSEPGLVEWANKNSEGLKTLIAASGKTSAELGQIQKDAAAAYGTLGEQQPGLLASLADIDLSKIQTAVPTKDPDTGLWSVAGKELPLVVQSVMSAPVNQQAQMSTSLATLSEVIDAEELKGYTAKEIENLQLDKLTGNWKTVVDTMNSLTNIQNLTKPEEQLDAVTEGYDIADINSAVSDSSLYAALGFDTGNVKDFDKNNDGKFDAADVTQLYAGVQSIDKPTTAQILDGTYQPPAKLTLQAPTLSTSQRVLADAAKDNNVTAEEVATLTTEDLIAARDKLMSTGLPQYNNLSRSISSIIKGRTDAEVKDVITSASGSFDSISNLSRTGLSSSSLKDKDGYTIASLDKIPLQLERTQRTSEFQKGVREKIFETTNAIATVNTALKSVKSSAARVELNNILSGLERRKQQGESLLADLNDRLSRPAIVGPRTTTATR
jgi:LysM repeat protein